MDPPARNSSRKTSSRALAGQQHAMEMHVNRPPGFVRDPSTSSSGCPPNSPDDVGDPQRWKAGPRPALGFLGDETSKELQRVRAAGGGGALTEFSASRWNTDPGMPREPSIPEPDARAISDRNMNREENCIIVEDIVGG